MASPTEPSSPAFAALEATARAALATYANVHRGSGQHAILTTQLYEEARAIVLRHLGLDPRRYVVVFASPRRATRLQGRLGEGRYRCLSSHTFGLPLGLRALAIERQALPKGIPLEPGGGTARLVGRDWTLWSKRADRFEPGTPAIIPALTFARALQLIDRNGPDAFRAPPPPAAERPHEDLATLTGADLLAALRPTLIGYDARVPTRSGERRYVNLDNAASTPTFQPIWDAAWRAWRAPVAEHAAIIARHRAAIAECLGASLTNVDLLFTANTTEALNLVAESLGREDTAAGEPVVLNTLLEHNSNELPWRTHAGQVPLRLSMDSEGFLDLGELEARLRSFNHDHAEGRRRITLVAVSGASNVLGTYPPLAAIAHLAHRYGARLLVDAAQLVAHREIRMDAWGIDYLAFAGHKAYAPFGTGVLLARQGGLTFTPDERAAIHASGEENVGGIAGLGHALGLIRRIGFPIIQAEEQALTRRALRGLARLPGIRVHGMKDPEAPRFEQRGGIIIFDGKGKIPSRMARALAEQHGIGVRAGCHCAHLAVKRILGIPAWAEKLQQGMLTLLPRLALPGVVRVSLGLQNTAEDVDRLLEALGPPSETPDAPPFPEAFAAYQREARDRVFAP